MTEEVTPPTFELQVMLAGKWRTDALFDDRQLAEDEADRALDSSRRPQSVRVVMERHDPATNLINSTVVYRRARDEEQVKEVRQAKVSVFAAEQHMQRRAKKKALTAAEELARRRAQGGKVLPAWVWILLIGTGMVIGLFMTLVAVHSVIFGK